MVIMGIVVERSNGQVKVVTVCEVLGNVAHYADTGVAVVGRMEASIGLIDRSDFLSQDRCEHPVITHGHVWPDKIRIWAAWEPGMPKPPSDSPNSLCRKSEKTACSRARLSRFIALQSRDREGAGFDTDHWVFIKSHSSKQMDTRLCTPIPARYRITGPLCTGG
jgi:hypothetical protein